MNDEFKRKLTAYENGELTGDALEDFEEELAKLEDYQHILDDEPDEKLNTKLTTKKQQRIMFIGKWKARFQTAVTLLGIIFIFTFFSSLITNLYYTLGTPTRMDVYREVIDHTLTLTDPYGYKGRTSTGTKLYFGLEATRDLNKVVGRETIKVGEMEVNMLLSLMGSPEKNNLGRQTQSHPYFIHPDSSEVRPSSWDQLEQLPEGTVVSVFVSFNDLLETSTVEDIFSDREMDLLWLAVEMDQANADYGYAILNPIGFPNYPIWLDSDMIVESQETDTGLFGSGTITESARSPDFQEGEHEIIHEQFIKTLYFLKEHESKVNSLIFGGLDIEEKLNYIEDNGIQHYGAVITGPTKEILTLEDEPLISKLEVDEVEFWNWD